jgi:hypothetical protein
MVRITLRITARVVTTADPGETLPRFTNLDQVLTADIAAVTVPPQKQTPTGELLPAHVEA